MKQEEPEVSDELQEMKSLSEEFATHRDRLSALHKKGALKDVTADEFASTIMPLLADFATAQLKHAAMVEDWMSGVEEEMDGVGQRSDLSPSDVELFRFLIDRLVEFTTEVKNNAADNPSILKTMLEIEVRANLAIKTLDRLSSPEEEDDDDDSDE